MTNDKINVDGTLLDRPFRIKRLGHFGINVNSPNESMDFYGRLLGFEISDHLDFAPRIPEPLRSEVGPTIGLFTRHGTDHHSFVLFPKKAVSKANPHYKDHPDLSINQITWQVSTLREVVNGHDWVEKNKIKILRAGRDTPGSNWHFYPVDPDGHINELYYGIEQIGWSGLSKSAEMHTIKHLKPPELPHPSEFSEVSHALEQGIDIHAGWRKDVHGPETFDVGGVLLARPFKVARVGPLRIFVEDLEEALQFYTQTMGLRVSEEVMIHQHRCVFLRANTEHHSIALYPRALAKDLKLPNPSSLLSFAVQVGSYRQLLDAVAHLKAHGVKFMELPREISSGIAHHAFAIDPDGFLIELYWEMEQIGWDGKPRPAHLREHIPSHPTDWPAHIEQSSDAYGGEVFLGPLN